MILRSGKVLTKRPKHSSADSDGMTKEEGEDVISKLPDVLLTQILSLLPEADANRTRILSKRWKDLSAFLPNLRFVTPFCWSFEQVNHDSVDLIPICWSTEKVNKFHDSVDQTLALRGGMPIQRFFLDCSLNCDYDRVYNWLCSVVQCKVQELELRFPPDGFRVRFCWDLFKTCNTLVSLTLKGEIMLDVPEAEFLFPCLKKLNLLSVVYSGDQSLANLICGCPVLEELFVERGLFDRFDNLQTFKVSSPSLKRIRIWFRLCDIMNHKAVIDAPKLEYIYIFDIMSTDYSFTEPSSLVEAHISNTETIAPLVTSLSSTKILTLTYSAIAGLSHIDGFNMPMFPNLVKLVIGIDCICGWNLLPVLLNNMPNLEHIAFSDWIRVQHLFDVSWDPPVEPPACLRFKIKEITILHREAVTQEEFTFIKYLLKHSNNFVTFTIKDRKINPKMRKQLLKLHRASNLCRIDFV